MNLRDPGGNDVTYGSDGTVTAYGVDSEGNRNGQVESFASHDHYSQTVSAARSEGYGSVFGYLGTAITGSNLDYASIGIIDIDDQYSPLHLSTRGPLRNRGITNAGPNPTNAHGQSHTGLSNGAHQDSQGIEISIDVNGNGTSMDEAAAIMGVASAGFGLAGYVTISAGLMTAATVTGYLGQD